MLSIQYHVARQIHVYSNRGDSPVLPLPKNNCIAGVRELFFRLFDCVDWIVGAGGEAISLLDYFSVNCLKRELFLCLKDCVGWSVVDLT